MNQLEKANRFAELHRGDRPLILFNAWDAGSARAVAEAGASAIATGSWSVAEAHGFHDGEKLPLDHAIANLALITRAVDLPVSLDFEGGYAPGAAGLKANIGRVIGAGAVGINFEDQVVGGEGLYDVETQSARIRAVREAAERSGVPLFINARSDLFLKAKPPEHDDALVEEAIERARAYAGAGASGFFVPGLRSEGGIRRICEGSTLPVNVLMYPGMPGARALAELGVARISYGPFPYRQVMQSLTAAARDALAW